jgi:hypothetical protein
MPSSFRKHFTREAANAGVRVNIPDSDDWIHVLGQDSDAFRKAQAEMRKSILGYVQENGEKSRHTLEFMSLVDKLTDDLKASLVADWSFEETCTVENVKELFLNAPAIAELVDVTAGKREKFVQPSPQPSGTSPSSSSN